MFVLGRGSNKDRPIDIVSRPHYRRVIEGKVVIWGEIAIQRSESSGVHV